MDETRVKELAESLKSIKSAKFDNPNWTFIGFTTEFEAMTRKRVIRTHPLNHLHAEFTRELNEAIKPVLDKYIKIFEDEIIKCCTELNNTT
jgi:predicted membrane GTPase involved in stress response